MADTGNWADFLKSQLQYNANQNRNLLFGTPSQEPPPPVFVNPLTGDDITSKITGGEGGGTQGPGSQPSGYGGFNREMGMLSSLAGVAAGGFPGFAMGLAGMGLRGLGKVAPESLTFSPNLAGPYGFNVSTPEEEAAVNALLDAMGPVARESMEPGALAKASSPFSTAWQSLPGIGGPLAAMTPEERNAILAAYGIKTPESTYTIGPRNTPIYGPRAPEKMPEYGWLPNLMETMFGTPPTPPASPPPGYAPMDVYGEPTPPGELGGDPGYGAPGLGGGYSGDPHGGDAPGGGPGGQDPGSQGAADTGAEGQGGEGDTDSDGGGWARGGVSRVRRTSKATYGEPGTAGNGKSGETAIFIPEMMKRLGLQGRERDVIRALREALKALEPPKKAKSRGL